MRLIQILIIFVYIVLKIKITTSLRTCTVIAPEFLHSARKYSLSLAVNNLNISSQFEVTIESINFKDTRTIELQPNGVQIVEFNLPVLPRDEYVLRVRGENGIYTQKSTLLKYAVYKPFFVIQTDKYFYRHGETLYYRILCMNENLRPIISDGPIDIKIMTQDHRIIYHKRSTKLDHFVIRGEFYLSSFELTNATLMQQNIGRLTVSIDNEILAAVTFQIGDNKIEVRSNENPLESSCEQKQHENYIVSSVTSYKNSSSKVIFTVKAENGGTEKILKQDKVATFKLNSSIPFKYFIFTIIGRGNIIHCERMQLLEAVKEHSFQIKPTNRMAPLSKLLVYFIDENNDFHYDEIMFNVGGMLENKIILSTTPILNNRKLELNITTAAYSYVGLLAIEESDEHKNCHSSNNDIKPHELLKKLGGNYLQRGELTGSIILTTANRRANTKQYKKIWNDEEHEIFEMRTEKFRKTWFFAEIFNTTTNNFILTHNLPNADTKWRITAFALHSEAGLGFTKLEPSLQTRKSYNVTIELPEFIYQNEIINIPIRIFNFLNEEIQLRVEFIQEDYDIELIPIFTNEIDSIQNVVISKKSYEIPKYTIRSSRPGTKYLKFLFFSLAGDYREIVKIIVKSKGVSQVEQQIYFINLQNFTSFNEEIFPNELFNQDTMTDYPRLALYANLVEPILEYLSKESGDQTAEQAASMMAMSCLSLNYLKLTDKQDTVFETQILRNMHKYYLNLLDYRDEETGSFRHFFSTESFNGSSWLTAYVGMWLPCAKKHINIDETIIETALDYLAATQNDDGSFKEKGFILNSLVGNNTLAMTAQILLAFLENNIYYTSYKPVMERGIQYIVRNLHKTESLYAKVLSTYTFYKAGFQGINEELSNLEKAAHTIDDHKFWAQGSELELNNVATTALVLLTAFGVTNNFDENYGLAFKWIIEKGGIYNFEYRGLYPTQASVLSLEVLMRYLQQIDISTKTDLTVGYRGLFRMEYKDIELTAKSAEKQFLMLNNYIGSLEINAIGQGSSLALINFNYQNFKYNNEPQFEILVERPSHGYLVSFDLKVCIKYEGFKEYADLTIIEINMPSGYVIQKEHLEKIMESESLLKHATINSVGSEVKLYILGLQRDKRQCFSLEPFRLYAIAKQVRVPILCYEYTDIVNMAVAYYDIVLSTCDLCDGKASCIKNCHTKK